MEPFGLALRAYSEGDHEAEIIFRRDDGYAGPVKVSHFFRGPAQFSPIEKIALNHARGSVLDAGGGTGIHSLVLQDRGFTVTALDINPDAVEIMRHRGVKVVRCGDLFDFAEGPFDTVLLLGHGIGMVETITGLDRFLAEARRLVTATGQILLDSMDVGATSEPEHLAYHDANRKQGRYMGEIRMRIEHANVAGPYCFWLQVDPATLEEHARKAGWHSRVLATGEGGDYLASLSNSTTRAAGSS